MANEMSQDPSKPAHGSTTSSSIASGFVASPEQQINTKEVNPLPPLESPDSGEFNPSRNFMLAFSSICIITLAAALDATSLSIALPMIAEKLHGTAIEAFWSGTSFLLTSAVFQPVIAGLSHVFGRKEIILLSSLFFAVGSIVAAVSKDFTYMLVGRSIQGIGGGGILALGEILVTDLVPLKVRGAWFGYLGAVWALGSVTGPLMGGAFAQNVSWRWIFWINLPIIGVGVGAIIFFMKLDKLPGTVAAKLQQFDWIGSIIFIGSTVSFLIPVTWGGVMYSWDSWRVLFPLLFGVACMVVFGLWERRLSQKAFDADGLPREGNFIEPIIRGTIFNNRSMLITYTGTVLHGIILWSLLYFLPLYYEAVKGYTPIISGVAMLPESGFVAPMAVVVGIVCAITGRYRWAIWVGWFLTTLGSGLLLLLKPTSSIPAWLFLNIVVSIGTGMLFPAMGLGVQAAGRPRDAGHAAAFYSFSRVFGQSIGVAISGVAFQNQIKSKLLSYPDIAPLASQYSKDAAALVTVIKQMPHGQMRTDLIQAYSDALGSIWILMTALAAVGLVSSLFIKGYSLNQELDTKQAFNGDNVKSVDAESGESSLVVGGQESVEK